MVVIAKQSLPYLAMAGGFRMPLTLFTPESTGCGFWVYDGMNARMHDRDVGCPGSDPYSGLMRRRCGPESSGAEVTCYSDFFVPIYVQ
ncbi:hypothetical protein VTH06DRAFT_1295 [Thermothelomyces fergusii]